MRGNLHFNKIRKRLFGTEKFDKHCCKLLCLHTHSQTPVCTLYLPTYLGICLDLHRNRYQKKKKKERKKEVQVALLIYSFRIVDSTNLRSKTLKNVASGGYGLWSKARESCVCPEQCRLPVSPLFPNHGSLRTTYTATTLPGGPR